MRCASGRMADAEKHLNLEAGVSSSCLLEGRFGSCSGFKSPWASLMLGRNGVLKSPSRQQISAQGGSRAAHMPHGTRRSRPAVCAFFQFKSHVDRSGAAGCARFEPLKCPHASGFATAAGQIDHGRAKARRSLRPLGMFPASSSSKYGSNCGA